MNEEKSRSFISGLRRWHRNFDGSDFSLVEKHQRDLLMAVYPMILMAFALGSMFCTGSQDMVLVAGVLSMCALAFMILRRLSLCFQAKDLLLRKRIFDLP